MNSMIRIIYSWQVGESNLDAFRAAWSSATTSIKQNTPGARGSVMLQSREAPTQVKTIARWDSHEDWQRFWEDPDRTAMSAMHELAELISVESFDELGEHTV